MCDRLETTLRIVFNGGPLTPEFRRIDLARSRGPRARLGVLANLFRLLPECRLVFIRTQRGEFRRQTIGLVREFRRLGFLFVGECLIGLNQRSEFCGDFLQPLLNLQCFVHLSLLRLLRREPKNEPEKPKRHCVHEPPGRVTCLDALKRDGVELLSVSAM